MCAGAPPVNERVAIVWLVLCKSSKRCQMVCTHYVVLGRWFIEDASNCLDWPKGVEVVDRGAEQSTKSSEEWL